jgi:hypothetical protein
MPSSSESLYAFGLGLAFFTVASLSAIAVGCLATEGSSVPPEVPPGEARISANAAGPEGKCQLEKVKEYQSIVDGSGCFTIKKLAEREELAEANRSNSLGRQTPQKSLTEFIGLFSTLANRPAALSAPGGGRS